MFILAALAILGGDSLQDFAIALLVGLVVGTYSSVFIATPLLTYFQREVADEPGRRRRRSSGRPRTPAPSSDASLAISARALFGDPRLMRGVRHLEGCATPSRCRTSPQSRPGSLVARVGSPMLWILLIVVLGVVAYRYRVKILARLLGQPERRIERQIGRKKDYDQL